MAKVLQDHVKKGKKFIPPFIHHLGAFEEISWRNDVLPQIIWIGLVHASLGEVRAVKILTTFTRIVRKHFPASNRPVAMGISEFGQLSRSRMGKLVAELGSWPDLAELGRALSPLLVNYPDNPISKLIPPNIIKSSAEGGELTLISELIAEIMPRHSRTAIMTQATATWFAFDSGMLVVNEGLPLARFPEIQNYPKTEISLQVASGVRTTVNMCISRTLENPETKKWNRYFWNRGYEISECCSSE